MYVFKDGGKSGCYCCWVAKLCLILCDPMDVTHQASLSSTISQNLLKSMSIELVMLSNHLVLCRPLLLLPAKFPSIRVFSSELALCIRISPSNEYSGLIFFRVDWFDPLQSKGLSIIFSSATVWKHQFFGTHASLWFNSHVCTWLLGKPIALTKWTLIGKVVSLLFNTSRFVVAFLLRSKQTVEKQVKFL